MSGYEVASGRRDRNNVPVQLVQGFSWCCNVLGVASPAVVQSEAFQFGAINQWGGRIGIDWE